AWSASQHRRNARMRAVGRRARMRRTSASASASAVRRKKKWRAFPSAVCCRMCGPGAASPTPAYALGSVSGSASGPISVSTAFWRGVSEKERFRL
ncbi:hypothetical protein IWW45_007232, partial [Coemansia sp. RSA 485]